MDRAAFVVALGQRLRAAGVPVSFTALGAFSDGLGVVRPADRSELYWTARVTLVDRAHDLATFDMVFESVFSEAALVREGHTAGHPPLNAEDQDWPASAHAPSAGDDGGPGLPWHTLPRATTSDAQAPADSGSVVPELLPSAVEALADVAFDELDADQLAVVGNWLETVVGAVADAPQPASTGARDRPSGRAPRDDRGVTSYRLGGGAGEPVAGGPAAAVGDDGDGRQ